MLSNLVAKGQVLFDNRLPPASPPPAGMIKASDAQAAKRLVAGGPASDTGQLSADNDNNCTEP